MKTSLLNCETQGIVPVVSFEDVPRKVLVYANGTRTVNRHRWVGRIY